MSVLSEKTRREMAAGREATGQSPDFQRTMLNAIHHEAVSKALKPLQKRFPAISGPTHIDWDMKDDPKNWRVEVTVRCPNGDIVQPVDNFVGFPSDELIATLMLLVG